MVSLESTAKKLTKQKQETSKIRRYSEREFQKAKSLSRKYSSSLSSIQKRVATSREQIEDISHVLNQKISQLQSVQRLKNAAQEKLDLEIQNKEMRLQDLHLKFMHKKEQEEQDMGVEKHLYL